MPQKSGRKGLQPGQLVQQTTSFAGVQDPDIEVLAMPFYKGYPRFMGKTRDNFTIRRYLGRLNFKSPGPDAFVVFDYIAALGISTNIRHFSNEKAAIDGYFDRVKSPSKKSDQPEEDEDFAKKYFEEIYRMLS